jgi:hypothetical protein
MRRTLDSQRLMRHWYKCFVGKPQWDESTSVVDGGMIAHKEGLMVGTALRRPWIIVTFYKAVINIPVPRLSIS